MRNIFPSVAVLIAVVLSVNVRIYESLPLPLNQYAYMIARNQIKNVNEVAKGLRDMSDKERLVNLYMEKLKSKEFDETKENFFASRPIEENLEQVQARPLYQLLKKFPKGGNMHMHEFQMLDRRRFLQMIKNSSEEYDMLYICDKVNNPSCTSTPNNCTCTQYFLKYFKKNVPPGWVQVKNSSWTIDKIVKATTLTGLLNSQDPKIYPTDSEARWGLANKYRVFDMYSDLTRYNKTRFDYMKECLDSSLEENVQLIEFRRSMFGNLYIFDENGDEKPVDRLDQINSLIQFKKDYIAQHPEFIDYVFLIYNSRGQDSSVIDQGLQTVIEFQKQFPEVIRGFDLVGEEDHGHTLLFHVDTLIKGFNATYQSNNTFRYNFHASETNWPDDDNPAQYGDDVSTLDNSYDALVLKTHRIGHGIGFFKNPQLYDMIRRRKIAFEVCPTSNQILGYVSDLRNHPAINYIRSGIPIVFGGDDPGSFGYNEITVDIYLAYMAWGLNLHELKDIALNSIEYSTIPNELKTIGFQKFNTKWNSFIDELYAQACSETFSSKFNVTNVLPTIGPFNETNKVTVYGYGFELALCKPIECVFGNVSVPAQLNHIREITCQSPLGFKANDQVRVQIRYNNILYDTMQSYTFKTAAELKTPDDNDDMTTTTAKMMTTTTSNGIRNHSSLNLTFFSLFLLILSSSLRLDEF